MIQIEMKLKKAKAKEGKKLYTASYGNAPIVDVRAKTPEEAEEKLLFMLMYKLRGITLDFEPSDF